MLDSSLDRVAQSPFHPACAIDNHATKTAYTRLAHIVSEEPGAKDQTRWEPERIVSCFLAVTHPFTYEQPIPRGLFCIDLLLLSKPFVADFHSPSSKDESPVVA